MVRHNLRLRSKRQFLIFLSKIQQKNRQNQTRRPASQSRGGAGGNVRLRLRGQQATLSHAMQRTRGLGVRRLPMQRGPNRRQLRMRWGK